MDRIEALLFDVFGTCVDWRRSIARAVGRAIPGADAMAVALAWRAEYDPAMQRVRSGGRSYVPLEVLHRENLDRVLRRMGLTCADPVWLTDAWERLEPWPDVVLGLSRLGRARIVAPCSNGSIAMMTRLARHAGLRWDCILGADIARAYKPQPEVYLAATRALRLAPDQVMMVAAHNADLHAARSAGLATGFVARPEEYGDGHTTDLAPEADWDAVAADFGALASRLG